MMLEPEDMPMSDEDDGQLHANQVSAPLSRETLEALRAALASEENVRCRRAHHREG